MEKGNFVPSSRSDITSHYSNLDLPDEGKYWKYDINTSSGKYRITSVNDQWSIAIFDHDFTNASDYMCGYAFIPSNYITQDKITLEGEHCKLYLFVEWEF